MKTGLSESCYKFFSTLANPTRLAILEHLRNGPQNVSQLIETLGLEQSMVSHNLRTLLKCRFVFVRKQGKERVYSLNEDTMSPIFEIVEHHRQEYCPILAKCDI